jgi:hypothetical protein
MLNKTVKVQANKNPPEKSMRLKMWLI